MCGIAGIAFASDSQGSFIDSMTDALTHRGPDSRGVWSQDHLSFGHRRLCILDVSWAGHQPMISPSGRYVITYNGEIYNFQTLRQELEQLGFIFKGHSDTEVLLSAFEAWGIEQTLPKLNGMFAFGLWDQETQTLFLVRDRFGEKPLYYSWVGKSLIFASELKAFKYYPLWRPEIDEEALGLFLKYSYVPAPLSIYKGVHKLEPAMCLAIKDKDHVSQTCYWDVQSHIAQAWKNPLNQEQEALDLLDQSLRRSVKEKAVADVPLGCFLSGGIDSSLIAALYQDQSSQPIQTFTIGFHDTKFNEAKQAAMVAQHLGTDHHELYLGQEECLAVVPKLSTIYDEPFADPSQIPTYLLSQMARRNVTVCLSGDAGDELFGGYNRYVFAPKLLKATKTLPKFAKKGIGKILQTPIVYRGIEKLFPEKYSPRLFAQKLAKFKDVFDHAVTPEEIYLFCCSVPIDPGNLLKSRQGKLKKYRLPLGQLPFSPQEDYAAWMMIADTMTYLPGDILTKVDRASMAVSIETRVPFLDNTVFDLAWRIPTSYKIRGENKWILRELLRRYLPSDLIDRPKMGFSVPLQDWLRGPLKPWAEGLLLSDSLSDYFDGKAVRALWRDHTEKGLDHASILWNILVFEAWREGHGL